MNITICNGKGGVGKTTVSVLISYALAEAGKRVAVRDLDPQGTATAWLKGESGKVSLYDHASEHDAVLTDTPPRVDAIRPAIANCTLAILVCSPSPADLWTTRDTADAIRDHLPEGAKIRILFNGVQHGTILSRDLSDMADRIGVESLSASLSRRQCYQHAALMGWAALDQTAREEVFKAALEIVTL